MQTKEKRATEEGFKFNVMIRVRPPLDREKSTPSFRSVVKVSEESTQIDVYEHFAQYGMVNGLPNVQSAQLNNFPGGQMNDQGGELYNQHTFTFDYVFDQESRQSEVYEKTAKKAIDWMLQGYNSTLLAYGQTGTGKTFTMEGPSTSGMWDESQKGVIQQAIEDIFDSLAQSQDEYRKFIIRVSYLQIYQETINDLLNPEKNGLMIREDKKRGIYVEGLSEYIVTSPAEALELLSKGSSMRTTAFTKINDFSSRSHAVFGITLEQLVQSPSSEGKIESCKVSKLNLVDLAGSERLKVSGAVGLRLEECKKINQSLSALSKVISSLLQLSAVSSKGNTGNLQQPAIHIPYRNSKLTRLLEDSLGGNCITTLIGTISPCGDAISETLSTLKFSSRAKNIKNKPKINEELDSRNLVLKYEEELTKLKGELQRVNRDITSSASYFRLEEEKRRVEADRQKVLLELEQKSKEFLREREERRRLMHKIKLLESNLNIGSKEALFKSSLADVQLPEDGEAVNDQTNQNDVSNKNSRLEKYKELLLKQNNMLSELSTRLSARDETILQLQTELQAYDKMYSETSELLSLKNDRIDQLEKLLIENNIAIPHFQSLTVNESEAPRLVGEEKLTPQFKPSMSKALLDSDLKREIDRLKQEYNQQIDMIHQQSAEKQNQLREQLKVLEKNNRELMKIANQETGYLSKDKGVKDKIKILQTKIDSIIAELSTQSKPESLNDVAQNLLSLQKLVQSLQIEALPPKTQKQDVQSTTTENQIPVKSESRAQLLKQLTQIPDSSSNGIGSEMRQSIGQRPSTSEKAQPSRPSYRPSILVNMYNDPSNSKEKLLSRIINKK